MPGPRRRPRPDVSLLLAAFALATPRAAHAEQAPLGPLLDVALGVELGARSLAYSDPLTANLRPYDIAAVPLVLPALEVYPLSHTHVPIVREAGLVASYGRALGLSSSTSGGESFDTTWDRLLVGARQRLPLPVTEGAVLGASLVYGRQRFVFAEASPALTAELPEVAYETLRFAADGAFPAGPLTVTALAGYHWILSAGPVADRQRDAATHGFELSLGAAWPLGGGLDLRLRATYERYVYAFAPVPGDAYVAGGALDQIFHGGLAVGYAR
jgi:hypothetical protein